MGCFLACFGSSKDRKNHRRIKQQKYKVIPRDHQIPKCPNVVQVDLPLVVQNVKEVSNSISELRPKNEEPLGVSTRKKVTFNANVTTYEHIEVYDSTESLLEKNEKGETFPKSGQTHSDSGSQDNSDVVSVGSYPPNYRYGNCLENDDEVADYEDEIDDCLDDEEEEEDYDVDDDDDVDDDRIICEEVWCESIPVPSTESRTESTSVEKVKVNTCNARDRSTYIDPVLNPVENISQWKAIKSKPTNINQQKENYFLNLNPPAPKNQNQELAVDASLSNWLGSSTPNNKNESSLKYIEDRPVLGALTEDGSDQFSGSSCTPRKSAGRSPDDMPIIGSVGSYWSNTSSAKSLNSTSSYKGIPNTTSKYREDKKVTWHNTPFETRLEKALNKGAAEAS
ncbi:uncharacterized protein [Rutidosis leptorrhynchoides]|uniref:uncharacterized protein n=1 Tax=Rutidosis leptorrhynchoides TaxID=125765 RepID=UPI003A99ECE7